VIQTAEEVTQADYEAKKKEIMDMEAAAKAKGIELVDPNGKPLYKSKIFWANVLAIGALIGQQLFGYSVNAEEVGVVLGAINIVLRYLNKDISGVVA
jgi:hypothetical protein